MGWEELPWNRKSIACVASENFYVQEGVNLPSVGIFRSIIEKKYFSCTPLFGCEGGGGRFFGAF